MMMMISNRSRWNSADVLLFCRFAFAARGVFSSGEWRNVAWMVDAQWQIVMQIHVAWTRGACEVLIISAIRRGALQVWLWDVTSEMAADAVVKILTGARWSNRWTTCLSFVSQNAVSINASTASRLQSLIILSTAAGPSLAAPRLGWVHQDA